MKRALSLLALSLALAGGCNRGKSETATEPAEAAATPSSASAHTPKADAGVLSTIEALGDRGAVVIVARQSNIGPLVQALAPWIDGMPPELKKIATAAKGAELAGAVAYFMGRDPAGFSLEGWDQSRPVVASLFETPYEGPPGSITPSVPAHDGWMPPMRNQVVVPATDPAALKSSLGSLLEGGTPRPAVTDGRAGATAVEIDGTVIALLPQSDSVRVVLFASWAGMDEAARDRYMHDNLDAEPAAVPHTAARHTVLDPDAAAAGWVRTWRIRPLLTWQGSTMVVQALQHVAADQRTAMMLRGMQIVADGEWLSSDLGADADDLGLMVRADGDTVHLHAALSLTPSAQERFGRAVAGAGKGFATKVGDPLAQWITRADLGELASEAAVPPHLAEVKSALDILDLLRESGYLGMIYMVLRHPLGMGGLVHQLANRDDVVAPMPRFPNATHVVVKGVRLNAPAGGLAVQWPEGTAREPLLALEKQVSFSSPFGQSGPQVAIRERDGGPTMMVAVGASMRTVFDVEGGGGAGPLMEGRLSLDKLRASAPLSRDEAALLPPGSLAFSAEHVGRALVATLSYAPKGGEVKVAPLRADESAKWDSPVGAHDAGPGVECLARASRAISGGMQAANSVATDHRALVAGRALAEARAPLTCAAKDPATKDASAKLGRMGTLIFADHLEGADARLAVELLDAECKAHGDKEVCARHEAWKALPMPVWPKATLSTSCEADYQRTGGDLSVRIDGTQIAVERAMVAPADLSATLAKLVTEWLAKENESIAASEFSLPDEKAQAPALSVLVSGNTKMAAVRPLLEAAAAAGVQRLVVQIETSRKTAVVVPLFSDVAAARSGGAERSPSRGLGLAPPAEVGEDGLVIHLSAGRATLHDPDTGPADITGIDGESLESLAGQRAGLDLVYAEDSATWDTVAATLASTCPSTGLVVAIKGAGK